MLVNPGASFGARLVYEYQYQWLCRNDVVTRILAQRSLSHQMAYYENAAILTHRSTSRNNTAYTLDYIDAVRNFDLCQVSIIIVLIYALLIVKIAG